MTRSDADQARYELYEVMKQDRPFEEKAEQALQLGKAYLGVENGHLTKIDPESDYWKAIASTDSVDGAFPPGLVLDLQTTYCRRTLNQSGAVALHDAPDQGWEDDPAFEEHGLHCYHGTTITLDEESYGTVCFVSRKPRSKPFTEDETMFAELIARILEHELRHQRTKDELDRLNEFASVLSHDLRNPLDVARGRVEVVNRDIENEHLTVAFEALDRMDELITDVLAMAQNGRSIDASEKISLQEFAEGCWQSVATRDAELIVDSDSTIRADPDRTKQLFENLYRNAVEHGTDDVTVRIGALDDGFYVEDDGPGIPEADRDSVLEAGYSTDESGSGLGLSIVEKIAAAHDWSIEITESPAGGARFEIRNVVVAGE